VIPNNGAIFYNHKPRIFYGQCVTPLVYIPSELIVRQIIVWARSGGVNFSTAFYVPTHEWIVVIAKPAFRLKSKGASGLGDVWMFSQKADAQHPAPFPLELPTKILASANGQDVLDPFAGSGTVGVACAKAGRKCTLIERNPRYCEVARRRVSEARTPLFDAG